MRIAVSGSSGLIGSAFTDALSADGHTVVRMVRTSSGSTASGGEQVAWDPKQQYVDVDALAGCEAVVHLAGAGIADHRWTAAYKRELRDSRVLGTAAVAEAVAQLHTPPRVLICGSALGYYGDTGSRPVDEEAPAGDGFLADLCQEWEAAAEPAREAGIRTVHTRTGLVVSRKGGAWGRLFPLFRAGLGGRLGDGRQYWSHIALHDHIAALQHLLTEEELAGPVNLTAPLPVTNREVTAAMGRVLRRPTPFPVPAAALRLALGEFAEDVLGSQRVLPSKLLTSGFRFAFPEVTDAIRAALR